jgi:hypothetical protein
MPIKSWKSKRAWKVTQNEEALVEAEMGQVCVWEKSHRLRQEEALSELLDPPPIVYKNILWDFRCDIIQFFSFHIHLIMMQPSVPFHVRNGPDCELIGIASVGLRLSGQRRQINICIRHQCQTIKKHLLEAQISYYCSSSHKPFQFVTSNIMNFSETIMPIQSHRKSHKMVISQEWDGWSMDVSTIENGCQVDLFNQAKGIDIIQFLGTRVSH